MNTLPRVAVKIFTLSAFLLLINACNQIIEKKMTPPEAKKIKKEFVEHNNTRIDNYYWLNERENPEVIAYLENEN